MRLTMLGAAALTGLMLVVSACAVPTTKRTQGDLPAVVPPKALGVTTEPLQPAMFVTKDLTTSTIECILDQDVWVGVTVTNTGGQEGTYPVVLMIDGVVARTANVTLRAGASEKVLFTLNQASDLPALQPTHTVSVDGLRRVLIAL
jgi:hypothetical protein